jgi:heme-degrading monooxygenase HmoA
VHNANTPRYALITSFESSPDFANWIARESA